VDGRIDPVSDKEIIDTELQLKDLESVEKKMAKIEKMAKSGDSKLKKELEILNKFKEGLESGRNVRSLDVNADELEVVSDLQLLTQKPVIYLANVEEDSIIDGNEYVEALKSAVEEENTNASTHSEVIMVSASIEAQIAELDDPEEKQMFLEEYGLKESGLNKLIRASYAILDLITYFTAGPKEVRAWTIRKGWKAPKAAGVIHTDFERGFIRAEVIKLDDYQNYKTEVAVKEAGKMSIEGKEYVVRDGDVMHFRFNV
jgi:hypothetical protein